MAHDHKATSRTSDDVFRRRPQLLEPPAHMDADGVAMWSSFMSAKEVSDLLWAFSSTPATGTKKSATRTRASYLCEWSSSFSCMNERIKPNHHNAPAEHRLLWLPSGGHLDFAALNATVAVASVCMRRRLHSATLNLFANFTLATNGSRPLPCHFIPTLQLIR